METIAELDREVATWRLKTFADSTKTVYASQLKLYLHFCRDIDSPPFPATSKNICRYAAFLARARAYSTVQQYLNVIRVAHLELGLPNPLKEDWTLTSLLKGVKRGKKVGEGKSPFSPDQLVCIKGTLNLQRVGDCQFWAALLAGFFGLLRISNITVKHAHSWDSDLILRRADVKFTQKGTILVVRWSKNNQFRERMLEVPLPLRGGHILCPTTALLSFFSKAGQLSSDLPFLAYRDTGGVVKVLTQAAFRARLDTCLQKVGISTTEYNTHSLRRGGATFLMASGVPIPVIRVLGDWQSVCVFKYLKPSVQVKMDIVQKAASSIF